MALIDNVAVGNIGSRDFNNRKHVEHDHDHDSWDKPRGHRGHDKDHHEDHGRGHKRHC